jgi:hypothetical protein
MRKDCLLTVAKAPRSPPTPSLLVASPAASASRLAARRAEQTQSDARLLHCATFAVRHGINSRPSKPVTDGRPNTLAA